MRDRIITADATGYAAQAFSRMSAQALNAAVDLDQRNATPFSGDVTLTNRRLGRDYPEVPTFQCASLREKIIQGASYGRRSIA